MKRYILCLAMLSIFFAYSAQAQTITTIAGTGTNGYNGDGIAAVSAQFNHPQDIAFDIAGNMYICDADNDRIRKVNSAGIISTIAGTSTGGYNGDDIDATNAQISYPSSIAIDAAGNIFFTDDHNYRIRKINTSGIITTIAGTGTSGFKGSNVAASSAQIGACFGIAVDQTGNLYYDDIGNQKVCKVDNSGMLTVLAGQTFGVHTGDGGPATAAGLAYPSGLARDAAGNIYFAEHGGNTIRKIDTHGMISTIAGTGTSGYAGDGGPATAALLHFPFSVTVDKDGNIFFPDQNSAIRRIDHASGIIITVAGTGSGGYNGDNIAATAAMISSPGCVKTDAAGSLYIADWGNNRVRYIKNTVFTELNETRQPGLSVYPNSNDGKFFMNIRTPTEETVSITVSDFQGRIVASMDERTNREVAVNLREYPEGVYVLTVVAPSLKATHERILIKH